MCNIESSEWLRNFTNRAVELQRKRLEIQASNVDEEDGSKSPKRHGGKRKTTKRGKRKGGGR